MATLINGNGNPAVYAQQDADLLTGVMGASTKILEVGSKLAYTIEDANTIAVADGVILTKEGRRIQVDVGNVDEFTIPTGAAGVTRYYIIGYHLYTDGSANQLCETFVQLMSSESETITENTFRGGASEIYVSLYRVTQIGLNLDTIALLLPIGGISSIIGDTDISDIADGTLTGGLSALNNSLTELGIRYNDETHYIQIKDNDTWYNVKYVNPSDPDELIPAMTSNTAPKGIASASSVYSGYAYHEPWKAMTGTVVISSTDAWCPTYNTTNQWIQYTFEEKPTSITKAELVFSTYNVTGGNRTFKIQGSDDGSTWHDMSDLITLLPSECSQSAAYTAASKTVQLDGTGYKHVRVFFNEALTTSGISDIILVAKFQLLGFE